jgi:hypothetical protein
MEENRTAIDGKIREWRDYYLRSGCIGDSDIDELEDHLREEIASLKQKELSEEEAFLIAVRRMGNPPSLSKEFRKINPHDLWKKLFSEPLDIEDRRNRTRDLILVVVLALTAGLLTELPKLFGIGFENDKDAFFYLKNLSFFVLPFITIFFIHKRNIPLPALVSLILTFPLTLLLMNLYPFSEKSQTLFLSSIHLPLCLWFFTGIAYTGSEWRDVSRRMDFLRFSGEIFIYTTLLFCGIFVLSGLTTVLFEAINIHAEKYVFEHFAVPIAAASPIIAAYLVDQKKSVVENFAPILARIFAPLLLCVMLVFLGVMAVLRKSPFLERDFLIGFDFMLIVVLGIVFYIISTREETHEPQIYDWISLILILVALVIDVVALSAIVFRLSSFGVSPNKLAALGENVLVFVNLAGMAILFVQFFRRKISFVLLEKWQTMLLPIYALWLGFVGLIFPLIFSFA